MECPKCKTDITAVYVVSEYTQIGQLSGNAIAEYESIEHTGGIGKTLRIECSECGEDITKFVKE